MANSVKSWAAEMTIGTLHRLKVKRKSKDVLRFDIIGGTDYLYGGIFVTSVNYEKGLKVGDRILAVHNNGCMASTLDEAKVLLKELPLEFDVLLLRLGPQQWKMLQEKCHKKPQMSKPGMFFKPHCRGINLPMMDGLNSTHGEIDYVTIQQKTGYPIGLSLACFGKKLQENPKDIGCVFITEVMAGGLAARCPLLARGCRILEINGRSTLSISVEHAEKKITNSEDSIHLVVQRLDDDQFNKLMAYMLGKAEEEGGGQKAGLGKITADSARRAKATVSSLAGLGVAKGGGDSAAGGSADAVDEDGLPLPGAEDIMADAAREEEARDAKILPATKSSEAAKVVATGAADMKRIHRQATMKKTTPAKEEDDGPAAAPAEAIKKPMHLAAYDGPQYDKLDQNLETTQGIPRGVDDLNRYYNILPNRGTRVMLDQVPNTNDTTTYINANWVTSWDGTNKHAYIASQGPMQTPRNVADFWRMVWQHNVGAILMVTGITERGIEKCARYWPQCLYNEAEKVGDVNHGDINIRVMAGYRKEGFITSHLLIQKTGCAPRKCIHYWFDSWPDHGVPALSEPAVAMIEAVRAVHPDNKVPWIVHCSAGIGRTGTMIAIDHGMHLLRNTGRADTLEIIAKLRKCRGGMVQHPVQAEFVHQTLARYVDAHGSMHELGVLEDALNRAMQAVPTGFTMHPSQIDTDEGTTEQLPSWRKKEIAEREQEEADILQDEIDEARSKGGDDLANRKAKRAAAKKSGKAAAAAAALALLENTAPAAAGFQATGNMRERKKTLIKNTVSKNNAAHGSVKYGKITSRSYATLEGDFHLSSSGQSLEELYK